MRTKEEWLKSSVLSLPFSVRTTNCLESARIATVGDLVRKTEADLLNLRSFGKTSLREVTSQLAEIGLRLNMDPEEIATPAPPALARDMTLEDYIAIAAMQGILSGIAIIAMEPTDPQQGELFSRIGMVSYEVAAAVMEIGGHQRKRVEATNKPAGGS